jgi:uncharacterized membrane protein (UPF0127 family)/ATP-dependent DNA ligase/2'-5' RNA ligase
MFLVADIAKAGSRFGGLLSFVKSASASHGKNNKKSYGWAYVRIPADIRQKLTVLRNKIDPNDLNEDGKEGHPHITVMYGFTESDPDVVIKAVKANGGGKVRLGKTSLFKNDERDVLKVSITGRALHNLHKALTGVDNEETFKIYIPHVTLAYLKAGTGEKYKNMDDVDGLEFTFDEFVFEDADDEKTEIALEKTAKLRRCIGAGKLVHKYAGLLKVAQQNFAPGIVDKAVYGDVLGTLKPGDITDFVLQHHKTTRNPKYPHYDLRLGTKDTNMYSWAIPKAELPKPGSQKLAPQTQLHTHQYNDFTGTIAQGYGAGTVSMADKGKAIITRVTPNTLHFTLGHSKVPTRYVLVHTGGRDGKMWQLIGKHDPSNIPGVGDKPVYAQISADTQDEALAQAVQVQEKIDGASGVVNVGPKGEVDVYSVNKRTTGEPISHTERMGLFGVRVPPKYKNTSLRGEMYYVDEKGKSIPFKDISGILNMLPAKSLEAQRARKVRARIALFDTVQYQGKKLDGTPLTERQQYIRELLKELPSEIFHEPQTATDQSEKETLVSDIREGRNPRTQEGVMTVMPDGTVRKLKNKQEATGYLTGTFPGTGKRKGTAGGLTFVTDREDKDSPAGKIGTGFTDRELADIVANLEQYMGKPLRIEHQGRFDSGKLRAPSFKGFEIDKHASVDDTVCLQFKGKGGTVKAAAIVEIADTYDKRKRGLSHRSHLPDNHGMFFDKVGTYWMKDVAFPLDIVFVDKSGVVLDKQAMPVDVAGYRSKWATHSLYSPRNNKAAHAIELPNGWCDRYDINVGDRVCAVHAVSG